MMRTRHEALEVTIESMKKALAANEKKLNRGKQPTPKGEKEPAGDPEDLDRFRAEFYAHRE